MGCRENRPEKRLGQKRKLLQHFHEFGEGRFRWQDHRIFSPQEEAYSDRCGGVVLPSCLLTDTNINFHLFLLPFFFVEI